MLAESARRNHPLGPVPGAFHYAAAFAPAPHSGPRVPLVSVVRAGRRRGRYVHQRGVPGLLRPRAPAAPHLVASRVRCAAGDARNHPDGANAARSLRGAGGVLSMLASMEHMDTWIDRTGWPSGPWEHVAEQAANVARRA